MPDISLPTMPMWALAAVAFPAVAATSGSIVAGRGGAERAWTIARAVSVVMVLGAPLVAVARVTAGAGANGIVRLDNLTVAMTGLIGLIGWVVIRYSSTYLSGDPFEVRYVQRMLATLAAVSVVVISNHVVVLLLAWMGASVALHGLLTFFGDRPVAIAVAHKKFLLARFADACMIGAAVLFAATFDTLRIDSIAAQVAMDGQLSLGGRLAIVLVAMAAIVKCAQLPFHGWLIQVMEAPTPVSALLHAGVVNLGGFVLLRFAPVVDASVETRTLLVAVGVFTAVAASLVMTTRVSIKVALAWSTCAQMGFMLVQCGVGLWEMALLHLLAHSAYKAHAFLGAGGTVRQTQRRQLVERAADPTVGAVAASAVLALAATALVGLAWQMLPEVKNLTPTVWVMLGIVALALSPLAVPMGSRRVDGRTLALAARSLGVPVAYLVLHEVAGRVVGTGAPAQTGLLVLVAVGFLALFAVQAAFKTDADGPLPRRARPWIYAGLFLDDAFTRVAFAVSPPPPPSPRPTLLPQTDVVAVVRTASPDRPTPSDSSSLAAAN